MTHHGDGGEGGVLVPGVTAPSSVTCVRSLGRRGISTVVGSEAAQTPARSSRYCDEFVGLPDPADDLTAYAEALVTIAQRKDVRTIIPVREEDIYALARVKTTIAEEIATPWPDFDTLRRVQDRTELFAAAEAAGVAAPETALVDEWDDWDREVIIKPRYTVAAPAYLGQTAAQYEIGTTSYHDPGTPADPIALRDAHGHVPLVQEYVAGPHEYGFFALYDHGEPVATFQHRQRRTYKYAGGPSAYRESVAIPALDTAGRALLDHLDWHGLAMVELLRDPDTGEFKLMEVNPRFWSSLPFTVQAGVDFPAYYWQLATDAPPETLPDYTTGIAGHLLRGEACHIHSVLTEEHAFVERPSLGRTIGAVGTSLIRHPRVDYLARDDPMPFVRDLLNVVRPSQQCDVPQSDGTATYDSIQGPPPTDTSEQADTPTDAPERVNP